VIYPPVDTRRFSIATGPEDDYLCLGRLIPYKRVDLAVHACTALGRKLKVGGSGRDHARLHAAAGPSVQFLGWVPSEHVPGLVARCRAFIFPGLEDFGIAPVQAMAAGRPVIAYAGGGSMDTVVDGVTGVLFREPTEASLQDAIRRFESMSFDPDVIRRHAAQFDVSVFEKKFAEFVNEQYSQYGGQPRVRSAASRT
jgi:glycosyltransferase involved in cell wall biosynthesis